MLGQGLHIIIGIGIAKGFAGGVVKVLPVDEGNGTFDGGLGRPTPPLKK